MAPQPAVEGGGAVTALADPRAAGPVLLVLPRADHVRGYAPLLRELARTGEPGPVVVSGAPRPADIGVPYHLCAFYRAAGAGGARHWLRFVAERERVARRLLRTVRPSVLVVPSDVADATAAFVEGARAAKIPIVYVQGAVVFPEYPGRNAAMYADRLRLRGCVGRFGVRLARALLAATGIHAVLEEKGVLGSRCDLALVMNEPQREVHRAAGVPLERLEVTGAPFIDGMVALRARFGDADRRRVRQELGAPAGGLAVFLTKSLFRLGWASREAHDGAVRSVVTTLRRELPEWTCVVKLHPEETVADYQALVGGDERVILAFDRPVEELLLASDLVLSLGTSSPAFAAHLFDLPLALINFTETPMLDAHPELIAAVPSLRTPEQLADALRAVAADPAALSRFAGTSRERTWEDGRASVRIAARLREVAAR